MDFSSGGHAYSQAVILIQWCEVQSWGSLFKTSASDFFFKRMFYGQFFEKHSNNIEMWMFTKKRKIIILNRCLARYI